MKPNKSRIPYIFFIFFGVFITVDIAYITIAEKTWRGLATEDGYQKGLKYNQTIEATKKQKELGWNLQIQYQKIAEKKGDLLVQLFDQKGEIIKDADLNAAITRPTQEGFDFSSPLKFDTKISAYKSAINFPLIGQWDVEIIAKKNDDIYQDGKRLVIR